MYQICSGHVRRTLFYLNQQVPPNENFGQEPIAQSIIRVCARVCLCVCACGSRSTVLVCGLLPQFCKSPSDIRVPFPVRHIRSPLIEITRKALSKTMTLRALGCTSNILMPKNCLTVAWCQSWFHVCVGENDPTLNISGALFTFKPSRLLTHLAASHAEVFVSFAPLSAWGPSKLSLRLSF